VAVDLPRKLLFLAIGTHISPNLMFQTLADLGDRDGMLLDGGLLSNSTHRQFARRMPKPR
jgi:hypothetical protein